MPAGTRFRLAHAIFFVSGVCGLGYQTISARWFSLGLGQELPSVLAAVAAFMGGLALGAFLLDGWIRCSQSPAGWYVGLETLIGVWALSIAHLIPWTNEVARQWTGPSPSLAQQALVAFGLPFLVLLPATAAMGASYPAIECLARGIAPGRPTAASLYAVNTFGAALGAFACAFWLLPDLGMKLTTSMLGMLNLGCAAAVVPFALPLGRRRQKREPVAGREAVPAALRPCAATPLPPSLSKNRTADIPVGDVPAGKPAVRGLWTRCAPLRWASRLLMNRSADLQSAPTTEGMTLRTAIPRSEHPGSPPLSRSGSNRSLPMDKKRAAGLAAGFRRRKNELRAATGLSARRLAALLFATGFLGIGIEVWGVRSLKLVLANTVHTFACLLGVYLGGMALGAWGARRLTGRLTVLQRLDWSLGGLALACVCAGYALWAAPALNAWFQGWAGGAVGWIALAEASVAAAVFLLPSGFMGATFATLAEAARDRWGSVGRALAWNTLGGALAPFIVAVVLQPKLGARGTLAALGLGYVLLRPGILSWQGAGLFVAVLATSLAAPDLTLIRLVGGERLRAIQQGASDTVAVVETATGDRSLKVNNRFTMGGTAAVLAERRQAHIPLLLHPAPKRALFLGSGTGITAAAATAHAGLAVDSVELVPEVVSLQAEFRPQNEPGPGPLRQYIADARRFVQTVPTTYDVIVADLFHPARDGAGGLFSREHYRAIRRRLEPRGLFCQWVPLHQMDADSVLWVWGTIRSEFPQVHAILLRATIETPVLGLVGAIESSRYPPDWLERRVQDARLRQELKAIGIGDTVQLLGWYLFDDSAVPSGQRVDTDDRQEVMHRAVRTLADWKRPTYATLFDLLQWGKWDLERLTEPGDLRAAFEARLVRFAMARDTYLWGLRQDVTGRPAEALDSYVESARLSDDFTSGYSHALTLAVQISADQPDEARRLLERLIEARPNRPTARQLLERLPLATGERVAPRAD